MMEENVEHIVQIDENIEIKLKIPKVMDALQLKALMHKADKIFKVSEVSLEDRQVGRPKREYNKVPDITASGRWTEEMDKEMKSLRSKGYKPKQIAEKMGIELKKVYQREYYLKSHERVHTRKKGLRKYTL